MDSARNDDTRRIDRILRGDGEALDQFVDDYYPRLYRFVHPRVGGDADATQDVVQSAFQKIIESLASYRGEAALLSWMCSICRFEIAAFWKLRARIPSIELAEDHAEVRAALESLALAVDSADEVLERKEVARLVRVALDHLPLRYGRVLEWKYLHGLSVVDISERLDLGVKATESLLTRARDAFRESFITLAGRTAS